MKDSLEDLWSSLQRPAQGLSAQLHPSSPLVWLALDSADRRHLLVRTTGHQPGVTLMLTRGLRAETAQISVEAGPLDVWADISCTDRSLNQTFLVLAADLVTETADANDPLAAVKRTLQTWQWFWGVDTSALSEIGALGLFGEMWFLDRWAPFPESVPAWHGADKERHDFSGPKAAVEVKTTRSHVTGPPTHQIETLDQLDAPSTGPLFLFSLQAIPESNAGNTLPGLIKRIRTRLSDQPVLLSKLDEGLALAGWTPAAAAHHATTYRVAAERLYALKQGFPVLTRGSFVDDLPDAIENVSYTLNLAACGEWLVADSVAASATLLDGLV